MAVYCFIDSVLLLCLIRWSLLLLLLCSLSFVLSFVVLLHRLLSSPFAYWYSVECSSVSVAVSVLSASRLCSIHREVQVNRLSTEGIVAASSSVASTRHTRQVRCSVLICRTTATRLLPAHLAKTTHDSGDGQRGSGVEIYDTQMTHHTYADQQSITIQVITPAVVTGTLITTIPHCSLAHSTPLYFSPSSSSSIFGAR